MPTASATAEQRRGSHLVFQLFYGRTLAWIDDMQGRVLELRHLFYRRTPMAIRGWRHFVDDEQARAASSGRKAR